MAEKMIIKNRYGLSIVALINNPKNSKGLVFLMHGFGGFKEHPLIELSETIFNNDGFTTIRFDATKSIGESEGEMKDGTITSYYEDLEDVIKWASNQEWYTEPFYLLGHSAGGYCVANYTIKNKDKIKKLILYSPLVSGELFKKTNEIKLIIDEWREKGIREWESSSNPGIIKQSKYDFIEDLSNHDLLKNAKDITCPVLLVSSENDTVIPIGHQKLLVEEIKNKNFTLIKNSDHNLRGASSEISKIINDFIKN